VPDLLDRTPPFVEAVVRGSSAERAGLRPDDLVIAVAGRSVGTRGALQRELGRLPAAEPMRLSVIRDGAIVEIDLGPKPRVEERPHREDER
jgi:serine protease Do